MRSFAVSITLLSILATGSIAQNNGITPVTCQPETVNCVSPNIKLSLFTNISNLASFRTQRQTVKQRASLAGFPALLGPAKTMPTAELPQVPIPAYK
ncbi:hypothetical protein CCUS01_09181 [Colletotrichum cuscutae]|uniref:Hydrophobin n=1 Tax=Colletotrichum cuscutae TaxID=1209917 RepID=A0AAI9ULC0_9PEZI|nr:hypothetical protein CCUS01_09181 [Colletotrichum cuscutae]